MRVSELLEQRRANWQELEALCSMLESRMRRRRATARQMLRFSALYRGACADLALADAYQLPPATIDYLHQLVGRAHSRLYQTSRFRWRLWGRELLLGVPGRLYHDGCLRLGFAMFWIAFILAMYLSSSLSPHPGFAEAVVGEEELKQFEMMYTESPSHGNFEASSVMAGFYTWNNTTIGLRVFAFGLLFGIGGIWQLVHNAVVIGAVFGHMSSVSQRDHFCHFVTAHGPFELTTIILSAAAGMRLGFALVATGGLTRTESLRKAGREAMPAMGASIVLFILAAFIEGFISPSTLPYGFKAGVGAFCSCLLGIYFVMLGKLGADMQRTAVDGLSGGEIGAVE